MSSFRTFPRSSRIWAAMCLLLPGLAQAELYCVATAAQLQSAIEAADASASASEIRVRTGSYTFAAVPSQYALRIDGRSDLLLTGGWTGASCQTRSTLNPEMTVLSMGGAGKLLSVEFPIFPSPSTHTVEISGISFRNAISNDLDPACVKVSVSPTSATERAQLLMDRNSFRLCNNNFATSPSALGMDVSNLNVYLRNNVFVDNASQSAIARVLSRSNTIHYISNNTIAHNSLFPGGAGLCGLDVTGANETNFYWVVNNVGWANGYSSANSDDLCTGGFTVGVVSSNLFGRTSFPATGVSFISNLSSEPRFISSNDLRPRFDSPLRDSGGAAAGGTLDFDLSGLPRVQGASIDRGAHEFEELLIDGFE